MAQCYIRRDKNWASMSMKSLFKNDYGLIRDSEDPKTCLALQIMTLTNRCRTTGLYTAMARISLHTLFIAE